MSKITSREELQTKICACTDSLKAKFEGKDGKRAICTLCLCILASDKAIAPEENAFLLRLIQ